MHKDAKTDCAAAMRQLWDYLDEELSPENMSRIREHIDRCQRCFPHYDWDKAFLEAIGQIRADRCAPSSLREKLEQKLRAMGFTGKCSREKAV